MNCAACLAAVTAAAVMMLALFGALLYQFIEDARRREELELRLALEREEMRRWALETFALQERRANGEGPE